MSSGVPYFAAGGAGALLGECRFAELLERLGAPGELRGVEALQAGIAAQHLERWSEAREHLERWGASEVLASTGPLVSIIIPTKDRRELLRRALASVANQTYRPLEAVVVNDGGEPVSDIATSFRDRITVVEAVHAENQYLAAARNSGVAHASGKYVGFLDDDDQLYPHHVGHLVGALLERPGCRAAAAGTLMHDLAASPPAPAARQRPEVLSEFHSLPFTIENLVRRNVVPVQAVLLEAALLEGIGLFDTTLRAQEDWELWLRLRRVTEVAQSFVPTACVDRRHESDRMSKSMAPFLVSYDELCRRNHGLTLERGGVAALGHQRAQLLDLHTRALAQAARRRILPISPPTDSLEAHRSELEAALADPSIDYLAVVSRGMLLRLRPALFPRLAVQLDADPRVAAAGPLDLCTAAPHLTRDLDAAAEDPFTRAALLEWRRCERGEDVSSLDAGCVLLRRSAVAGLQRWRAAPTIEALYRELWDELRTKGNRLRRAHEACLVPAPDLPAGHPPHPALAASLGAALTLDPPPSMVVLLDDAADMAALAGALALVDQRRAEQPLCQITLLGEDIAALRPLALRCRAPLLRSPGGLLSPALSAGSTHPVMTVLRLVKRLLAKRAEIAAGLPLPDVPAIYQPGLAALMLAEQTVGGDGLFPDARVSERGLHPRFYARCLTHLLAGGQLLVRQPGAAMPGDDLDRQLLSLVMSKAVPVAPGVSATS